MFLGMSLFFVHVFFLEVVLKIVFGRSSGLSALAFLVFSKKLKRAQTIATIPNAK